MSAEEFLFDFSVPGVVDCSRGSALSDAHKKLTQRFQLCYCIVLLVICGCFYDIRKQTQILGVLASPVC